MDSAALCQPLLGEGPVPAFLAEHRGAVFPDELFEDLSPSGRGRPSVPADVIATAMVLQALEGLSDRQAVRRLETDIAWKAAAGQDVEPGDDPGTWRIASRTAPDRVVSTVVPATPTRPPTPEVLGDSAYGSGELRDHLEKRQRPPSSSRRRCAQPSPEGSTSTTSTSTRRAGTVTCPAGAVVALSRPR